MIKQSQAEDHSRLKQVPFMFLWVASIGVAYLILFLLMQIYSEVFSQLIYNNNITNSLTNPSNFYLDLRNFLSNFEGLMIGVVLGVQLMLVQTWLLRRRYGFAPRFWRIATFVGMLIAGIALDYFMTNSGYYDGLSFSFISSVAVWIFALPLLQMFALWTTARRAWLYLFSGLGSFGIAMISAIFAVDYMYNINALFFGAFSFALFSGGMLLWLMRDYRSEAVQKNDEKSKVESREGLHSISFIGLWGLSHLFGWAFFLGSVFIVFLLSMGIQPLEDFLGWLDDFDIVMAFLIGGFVGIGTSMGQPWLMQQRNDYRPRFWIALSVITWTIAGLGLWQFMDSSVYRYEFDHNLWRGLMLLLWFGLPSAVQGFRLWRDYSSGWLYVLAALVSPVLAYMAYIQIPGYNAQVYTMVIGAITQAILTGAAYVMISQQKQAEVVVVNQG